jgi:hypothetical protein
LRLATLARALLPTRRLDFAFRRGPGRALALRLALAARLLALVAALLSSLTALSGRRIFRPDRFALAAATRGRTPAGFAGRPALASIRLGARLGAFGAIAFSILPALPARSHQVAQAASQPFPARRRIGA